MRLIYRFAKPYYKECLLAMLAVVFEILGVVLIPTITADMINAGVSGSDIGYMIQKGLLMLGAALISGLAAIGGMRLCAVFGAKISYDARIAIYEKSLQFSDSEFERFGTGSMITRCMRDVGNLRASIILFIQVALPVPVMSVMGIVFSFRINPSMGFLLLGIIFVVAVVAAIIVRRAAEIFEKMQTFLDKMNVVLRENFIGVRVIRAFNKENHERRRIGKSFEEYADSAIKVNRLFAGLDSLSTVAINLCIVAVIYIGGNMVGRGAMHIGDITAVTEYAILTLNYIISATMVGMFIPRVAVSVRRIAEVLNLEPAIQNAAEPEDIDAENREVIRFENVSFRFSDASEDTLADLCFSCEKGKTTAVIGGTGSGKSTIAKLILRYHDVSDGSILLKGSDLRNLELSSLRSHVAFVPQTAWLFSGSIADNLKYGDPEADEAAMLHYLDVAQADFVHDLPDGLGASVSQGGTNFSGGQKQRIAIARALAKKAELYIFDDSFSALDFKTDAALRRALKSELADSAILIITQRISTIVHADQIIVLDDGKIKDIGTHSYLMENCPMYRDIAESQSKGGVFVGK